MTATADTTQTGYCAQLLALLQLIARAAPGSLLLSLGRRDRAQLRLQAGERPILVLPTCVLAALESDQHIGVAPALGDDVVGEPISTAMIFARFRPSIVPSDDRGGYDVVGADAAKIRDALASLTLAPACLVNALTEVVAFYPLRDPLRDMPRARALQRRLAERLGAVTQPEIEMAPPPQVYGYPSPPSRKLPADDPGVFVPIAGKVRGAGVFAPWIMITMLNAERRYTLDEIDAALASAATKKGPTKS